MTNQDTQRGAVLLFTVLIVGLAAVAIMSVLATAGLNSKVDSNQEVSAALVKAHLDGCFREVLVQFNQDVLYNPGTINTMDAICTVMVTDLGADMREVTVSLTELDITRAISAQFSVNGMIVTSTNEP